ncbi:hypothetical protein Pelo_18144 [Pelomyxa schiedti]|nr:hypothetical protein Pelo_18144 [Pelomyxa schiedti]
MGIGIHGDAYESQNSDGKNYRTDYGCISQKSFKFAPLVCLQRIKAVAPPHSDAPCGDFDVVLAAEVGCSWPFKINLWKQSSALVQSLAEIILQLEAGFAVLDTFLVDGNGTVSMQQYGYPD